MLQLKAFCKLTIRIFIIKLNFKIKLPGTTHVFLNKLLKNDYI